MIMTSFVGVLSNNLKAEIAWIILWLKLELHQEHGPQGLHPKKRITVFNLSNKKIEFVFLHVFIKANYWWFAAEWIEDPSFYWPIRVINRCLACLLVISRNCKYKGRKSHVSCTCNWQFKKTNQVNWLHIRFIFDNIVKFFF